MNKLNVNELDKVAGGSSNGPYKYKIIYWDNSSEEQSYISEEYTNYQECTNAMINKDIELEAKGCYLIDMYVME